MGKALAYRMHGDCHFLKGIPMRTVFASHVLDDFFRAAEPARTMPVDVVETATSYELLAELPGVTKEEIAIEIDGALVTLSATPKTPEAGAAEHKVLRAERHLGAFSRRFKLGVEVDEANAIARFENGVLTLSLPKKAVETRRVTIQ
jgi:HSP20 family protein